MWVSQFRSYTYFFYDDPERVVSSDDSNIINRINSTSFSMETSESVFSFSFISTSGRTVNVIFFLVIIYILFE